eukprot:5610477-Amphidinium_carterae.1
MGERLRLGRWAGDSAQRYVRDTRMEVMGAQRDIAAFLRFASAEVERDSLQRFQDWCQARQWISLRLIG